jgi:hypothetical protein
MIYSEKCLADDPTHGELLQLQTFLSMKCPIAMTATFSIGGVRVADSPEQDLI